MTHPCHRMPVSLRRRQFVSSILAIGHMHDDGPFNNNPHDMTCNNVLTFWDCRARGWADGYGVKWVAIDSGGASRTCLRPRITVYLMVGGCEGGRGTREENGGQYCMDEPYIYGIFIRTVDPPQTRAPFLGPGICELSFRSPATCGSHRAHDSQPDMCRCNGCSLDPIAPPLSTKTLYFRSNQLRTVTVLEPLFCRSALYWGVLCSGWSYGVE